jgi:hypothetical protein
MEKITIKSEYKDLPYIVRSEDGQVYQLSYYDSMKRLIKWKIIEPKEHNGSLYYRIDGIRYSDYKLKTLEKRVCKKVNLEKIINK